MDHPIFKYFIFICVFVLLFCSLFGLNDRLSYDGIKYATESIKASFNGYLIDIAFIRSVVVFIQEFDSSKYQFFVFNKSGYEGMDDSWYCEDIYFYTSSGPRDDLEALVSADRIEIMDKVHIPWSECEMIFSTLDWFEHNPVNGSVLSTVFLVVKYFVGILIGLTMFIIHIGFNSVMVFWSLLMSVLYILGISS